MLSRHSVGNYQGNELTCNLSENTRPQSSQLADPLWTDSGIMSGISVRELISTLKKEKSAGWELTNFPQKSSQREKRREKGHHVSSCQ